MSILDVRKGVLVVTVIVLFVSLAGFAASYTQLVAKAHDQTIPLAIPDDAFFDILWGISSTDHTKATFISYDKDSPKLFLGKINRYIAERQLQPIEYSAIEETWRVEESGQKNYKVSSLFRYRSCTVIFATRPIHQAPLPPTPPPTEALAPDSLIPGTPLPEIPQRTDS